MNITPEEVLKIAAFVIIGFWIFIFGFLMVFKLFLKRQKKRIMREHNLSEEEFDEMVKHARNAH